MSEFDDLLTSAVADFASRGYVSDLQLRDWLDRLRAAARRSLVPEAEMERRLRASMEAEYRRLVDRGALLKAHPGVARFTLERVKPHLRAELDRRILASAELIRSNRQDAIETTLRRFSGWATSVPIDGTDQSVKRETKYNVKRALGSLSHRERIVAIDQSAKLAANISEILAVDSGALAGQWRSRWRKGMPKPAHYDARVEHHERDGEWFMVPGNWALSKGLMKVGPNGYIGDVERPGELPMCSCSYVWATALRDLPENLLTLRGKEELAKVRQAA